MSVMEKMNKVFRERVRNERLRLITEWDVEKVESLEKILIADIRIVEEEGGDGPFIITVDYEGCLSDMHSYRMWVLNRKNQSPIRFSYAESKEIRKWLYEMDIEAWIYQRQEEVNESYLAEVKERDLYLRVEDIRLKGNVLVYTLSNGTEMEKKIIRGE